MLPEGRRHNRAVALAALLAFWGSGLLATQAFSRPHPPSYRGEKIIGVRNPGLEIPPMPVNRPVAPGRAVSAAVARSRDAGRQYSPLRGLPLAPAARKSLNVAVAVFVFGTVARPGLVTLPNIGTRPRVFDAIRAAGRLSFPSALTAQLLRGTGAASLVLTSATGAALTDREPLYDGDVILVSTEQAAAASASARPIVSTIDSGYPLPNLGGHKSLAPPSVAGPVAISTRPKRLTNLVSASGAVLRTAAIPLQLAPTAARLLRAVGVDARGLPNAAYIRRGSTRIAVDIEAQMAGRAPEFVLQPGDCLYVPRGEQCVEVEGAVRRPGAHGYRPGLRLLDALWLCGGFNNLADVSASPQVLNETTVASTWNRIAISSLTQNGDLGVDLLSIFRDEDFSDNAPVAAGEHLNVPRRERVTVLGALRSPRYLNPSLALRALVRAAGGPPASADLARIIIMGGESRNHGSVFDLRAGAMATDTGVVRPGDIVWIGRRSSVAICGAVAHPGSAPLGAGLTARQALFAAGGAIKSSLLQHTVVLRPQGAILQTLRIDLSAGAESRPGQNPALQSGDLLIVPFCETGATHSLDRTPLALSPLLSFLLAPPTH